MSRPILGSPIPPFCYVLRIPSRLSPTCAAALSSLYLVPTVAHALTKPFPYVSHTVPSNLRPNPLQSPLFRVYYIGNVALILTLTLVIIRCLYPYSRPDTGAYWYRYRIVTATRTSRLCYRYCYPIGRLSVRYCTATGRLCSHYCSDSDAHPTPISCAHPRSFTPASARLLATVSGTVTASYLYRIGTVTKHGAAVYGGLSVGYGVGYVWTIGSAMRHAISEICRLGRPVSLLVSSLL